MSDTQAGNVLIAEFMGGVRHNHKSNDHSFKTAPDKMPEVIVPFLVLEDLKYHTSWDWLMPVVEKIENLGYRVYMERGGGKIYYSKIKERGKVVADCDTLSNQSRSQATWLCVIEFINWYNLQNKTNDK